MRTQDAWLWSALLLAGWIGLAMAAAGHIAWGVTPIAAASGLLLIRAVRATAIRPAGTAVVIVGAAVIAVGVVLATTAAGYPHRYAPWLAAGSLATLTGLGMGRRPIDGAAATRLVPVAGVALGVLGMVLARKAGVDGDPVALVAFVGAWGLLMLDILAGHWRNMRATRLPVSEGTFLGILMTTLISLVLALAIRPPTGLPGESLRVPSAVVAGAVLFSIAALSGPTGLGRAAEQRPGSVGETVLTGATVLLLLNVVAVGLIVSGKAALTTVFFLMTAWLVVAVGLEYATWLHGIWRRRAQGPGRIPRIEVLVTGKNEGATLDAAMARNMRLPDQVTFVLAVAANSTDNMVDVARRWTAAHPDRVRTVMGPGINKATDLQVAWRTLESEWVLLLDADESIDQASLELACAHIAPRVGIIQGRKVSSVRDPRGLHRFISVERRYSTRFDHFFWADRFNAGHFAGSGALVRREVPPAVGMWQGDTLTEDIDFSIRFHLNGRWRHVYEREWLIEEANPRTIGSFLRQRGRWARGWTEVCAKYLGSLVRGSGHATRRTRFGLAWQLIGAVSAPAMAMMPAVTLAWLAAGRPGLPAWATLTLAIFILPSRSITYPAAFFSDRRKNRRTTTGDVVGVVLSAYGWIVVGWFIQLHALYQEISGTRRTWHATDKSASTA